jgi:hypothetical protein
MADGNGVTKWISGLAASLVVVTLGSMLTIQQTLFAEVYRTIERLRLDTDERRSDVKASITTVRAETEANDARQSAELARRESEIKGQIGEINKELDARRTQFTDEREFKEFSERILADLATIHAQLILLEQTRPTTGELQATAAGLEKRVQIGETAIATRATTEQLSIAIASLTARIEQLYRIAIPEAGRK